MATRKPRQQQRSPEEIERDRREAKWRLWRDNISFGVGAAIVLAEAIHAVVTRESPTISVILFGCGLMGVKAIGLGRKE